MATYEEIKTLLDVKLEVITVKLTELKQDTEEIKVHAKETNGGVASNLERIHNLEVEQNEDNKFRKRTWYFYSAFALLILGEILAKIIG